MLIKLDKNTCQDFLSQGVSHINVDIINAGCAGSKISVKPRENADERVRSETHNGIVCWVAPEMVEKFDGAQIARAKGKYYLVSKKIQSRCGCGTSFSFEQKTVSKNLEKIHRLQSALKLSPEMSKIHEVIQKRK